MNLVRSIIVPQTMARDTAQNTNSKNHLAAAGAVLAAMAGRFICEPGLNVGKKPLPPITAKMPPAPNAKPKPTAQYAIELTLRLVTTLATTVPTFFMRLKPTSSIAKPACMNITRQPVTITQTVSAATPAACVAVRSSAMTAMGTNAAATVTAAASRRISLRFINACLNAIKGLGKVASSGGDPPARGSAYGDARPLQNVRLIQSVKRRVRAKGTISAGLWISPVVWTTRKSEAPIRA